MRKIAWCWMVVVGMVSSPAAFACKPLIHANPARDFIRIALIAEPPSAVVFRGEVVSLTERAGASGDAIVDAVMRPDESWLGSLQGLVVVRSFRQLNAPCEFPLAVDAREGEQWLVFGWRRDGYVEASVEPRASLRLESGRIPEATAAELRRIKARR